MNHTKPQMPSLCLELYLEMNTRAALEIYLEMYSEMNTRAALEMNEITPQWSRMSERSRRSAGR